MRRLFPEGFGTAAVLAALLAMVGLGQLASLFARDEPYRFTAALLALLMLAGAALLLWFIFDNRVLLEQTRARPSMSERLRAAGVRGGLLALAGILVALLVVHLYRAEGAFLPLRVLLFGPGLRAPDLTRDPPLPMLIAGTFVLALGVSAVCICIGALWLGGRRAKLTGLARITSIALGHAVLLQVALGIWTLVATLMG